MLEPEWLHGSPNQKTSDRRPMVVSQWTLTSTSAGARFLSQDGYGNVRILIIMFKSYMDSQYV